MNELEFIGRLEESFVNDETQKRDFDWFNANSREILLDSKSINQYFRNEFEDLLKQDEGFIDNW